MKGEVARLAEGAWSVLAAKGWTRERLEAHQGACLRRLMRHVWEEVPYLRERMRQAGVEWRDIRGVEDLARVPMLDAGMLPGTMGEVLTAECARGERLVVNFTSGTSGRPRGVGRTAGEERLLQLARLGVMHSYGMKATDARVSLRVSSVAAARPWWTRMGLARQRTMPPEAGAERLRAMLLEARPEVIEGHPSVLAEVGDVWTEADRRALKVRFLAAGGEPVRPDLRRRIERGFGAPVRDVYGASEFNLIAAECAETGLLHLMEASLVVEVLEDGRPVGEGEVGQLVATPLYSYAMPLVRWRLGDRVRRGPRRCPCGAPFATLQGVEGRVLDVMELPGGRRLHPLELVNRLCMERPWIRQVQFAWRPPGWLTVVVAAEVEDAAERLAGWCGALERECGGGVRVTVEQVGAIAAEAGGKVRLVRVERG